MRIFPLKIIPDDAKIDFVSMAKVSYTISIILLVLSFLSVSIYKLNFGIDFMGGVNIDMTSNSKIELHKLRKEMNSLNLGEISIQHYGNANDISLKVSNNDKIDMSENIDKIKAVFDTKFKSYNLQIKKIDFVGPQVGKTLIFSGIKSICLAFVAIMVYVWIRFEWQFGVGAIISLIHDVILSIGFMSISGLDFNQASIAAILTIVGYSVNDSVVIYDKVRENMIKYHSKTTKEIINMSVNQTLPRTTLTVITTLIANLALVLFGGEAIKSFSLLVFVGILLGTYSSIYVSASILIPLGINKKRKNL